MDFNFPTFFLESLGSTDSGSSSTSTNAEADQKAIEMANKLIEEQSAYERFAEDISNEDEDHLDFPLVDEERLLMEYISVLGI